MNGLDAARVIRRRPWGGDIKLIAVTGWGQESDIRRSQEAGFDDHLVKPMDPDALMQLIGSLDAHASHRNRVA
jgi:CheY-like chemotaxis protein